MRRIHFMALCAGLSFGFGCSGGSSPVVVEQDALVSVTAQTTIRAGLSDEVHFDVPSGVDSMLIEVSGGRGLYYLTELVTPRGRDMVEGGAIVTREAREIEGYVSWMVPMADSLPIEPGGYQLLLRGETASGGRLEETDATVTVHLNRQPSSEECRLNVDFLVAEDAIEEATTDDAIERLAVAMSEILREVDVRIGVYGTSRIEFPTVRVEEGFRGADLGEATGAVGHILQDALATGHARENALHIFIVRSLGSSTKGYSLGLPGPYSGSWPSAGVLVSAEAFLDRQGLLDPEAMAVSTAHEVGHYLGLFHTSEFDGLQHDPILDTPKCEAQGGCDDRVFADNLMTPGGSPNRYILSAGQGQVMRRHPLCTAQ